MLSISFICIQSEANISPMGRCEIRVFLQKIYRLFYSIRDNIIIIGTEDAVFSLGIIHHVSHLMMRDNLSGIMAKIPDI